MSTDITPIEIDGQYWIDVSMDGHEANRHGPFASIDEAEAMAAQFAAVCVVLHQPAQVRTMTKEIRP